MDLYLQQFTLPTPPPAAKGLSSQRGGGRKNVHRLHYYIIVITHLNFSKDETIPQSVLPNHHPAWVKNRQTDRQTD
jgi:hypothetical protein